MRLSIATGLAVLMVAAVLAPLASAGPKAVLPTQLPVYGQDKPLPVPQIAKKTLSNGLEVWVVPRQGLPRVDYVLAFRDAGLAADEVSMPGFADLLAGLLSEGTSVRDAQAIAETAQALGGGLAVDASSDGLTVSANVLASNAEPMLRLLAEVARRPSFPEKEVQLAKANALQALKAAEAQPGYRAERALGVALYGDHPYSRSQPTEASIAAVTVERLKTEHARRVRPDRALLVIAGRIEPERGFQLANMIFGDWRPSGPASAAITAAPKTRPVARVLLERPGSVQSTLRIGRPAVPASDPDYLPLRFANILLGGGFSSRLMQNLREDKGYTYGARSSYRAARAGGAVVAQADVRNEVTAAALKEFFAEYAKLGSEPVPAAEMEMNKRYIAGGYLINNQLQGAVAATLADHWLLGLPPEFLGEFVPRIQRINAEQVKQMARKYFDPATQSIVVVGDATAIAEQLKAFGEFKSSSN